MKILIGGATGFIGSAIVKACAEDGHEIVALVRGEEGVFGARSVVWDGKSQGAWSKEVSGADVVINLAGAPVSLKWTDANKRLIRDSRVQSTIAVRTAIEAAKHPPRVWLNASAVGFYGDTGDRVTDETSPAGQGFLPDVCTQWEAEATTDRCRVVRLRTGIVFGKEGGVFPQLLGLARAFVGGAVGSGRQYIPWIHLEDHIRLLRWCGLGDVCGPVNLCAPNPVTNAEMMAAFRQVLGRPWAPPAPAAAMKVVAALGGPDSSLVLESARVIPKIALDRGFTFRFATVRDAIADLVG